MTMEDSIPSTNSRWASLAVATLVVLNMGMAGFQLHRLSSSVNEQSMALRRNLLEVETVHAKHDKSFTQSTKTTQTTKTSFTFDPENNPNVEEPNTLYKPTYHYTSPHGSEQDSTQSSFFLKDETGSKLHDAETFNPRIAWLASFPNSGTSFTMGLVARATNTTFASNYGIEANFGSRDVASLPIYPRHPEGPYMPDPVTSYHHRKLPYGRYVMTKTHCGGYCFTCKPSTYAYGYNDQQNTVDETSIPGLDFLRDCASGQAVDGNGQLVDVSYPPERVSRVIHLYRNPMHNMIARFHLERKHHSDANTAKDKEWLEQHPDNQEGMSKFCQETNENRWEEEQNFFESAYFQRNNLKSDNTSYERRNGDSSSPTESRFPQYFETWKELVKRVPCRNDLFRYVQWHNLLHQGLDYLPYKMPVLTLYYEGFESSTYQATANSILDFLELQPVAGDDRGNVKWSEFHSRSDYDEFFSDTQVQDIEDFLQTLASFRVWGEIEHYFR